jgi:hypothetical protein
MKKSGEYQQYVKTTISSESENKKTLNKNYENN